MSNNVLTEEEFEILARFASIKDGTMFLEYDDLETIQKLQEKGYLTKGLFLENSQEKRPYVTELGKEEYQLNLEARFVNPRRFKGLSRAIRNYFTNL